MSYRLFEKEPTIYFASKTRHAPKWRAWRDKGILVISSWISEQWFEADGLTTKRVTGEEQIQLWLLCIGEASQADFTILYAEEGDVLKGGLIECGAALAANRTIIQVGDCGSLRAGDGSDASFSAHPNWLRASTIETAIRMTRE